MAQRSQSVAARIGGSGARTAFERAVNAEFDAIERHENAAGHHERIAAQLEQHARVSPDKSFREQTLELAANARQRAAGARARAAAARQRLRAEGIAVNRAGQ